MSSKFIKVKKYFEKGLWTKSMVKNAVIKGWITSDEYQQITSEVYEA